MARTILVLFVLLILLVGLITADLLLLNSVVFLRLHPLNISDTRDYLFFLAEIVAILLLLALTFLLIIWMLLVVRWLFNKKPALLPFDIAGGEDQYSGRALADMLRLELQRIYSTYERFSPDTHFEVPVTPHSSSSLLIKQHDRIPATLNLSDAFEFLDSENLDEQLANTLTVGVGQTKLSLGQLLVTLAKVWPSQGTVLRGSQQRYEQLICLILRMEGHKHHTWRVGREVEDDHDIENLVTDLAYKVSHATSGGNENLAEVLAKTWEGYKYFTEAIYYYDRYQSLKREEDLENARLHCIEAFEAEKDYSLIFDMLNTLGVVYLDKAEATKAEELFRYATKFQVDDNSRLSQAFLLHAWSLINEGNPSHAAEALIALEKAIELNPDDPYAQDLLGPVYDLLGFFDKATLEHQKSIDSREANPDVWGSYHLILSSLWLFDLGCYDKAVSRCRMAVDNATGSEPVSPQAVLGNLFEAVRRYDEAVDMCQKAIALYPNNPAFAYAVRAGIHMDLGQYNEAFDMCHKAIKADPSYEISWILVGQIYESLRRYDMAIGAYTKATKLVPSSVLAHISLASSYRKIDRRHNFDTEAEIARTLIDKHFRYNKYDRARLESVCGNVDEALGLLEVALERKEQNLDWVARDPSFDFIRNNWRFKALTGQLPWWSKPFYLIRN
jgi:tetratricopeptide (TPR) repeat protein